MYFPQASPMSVFIISTFVVFVTVRATSLPQSDWDSLGLATLAKEIPNQQLSSLESGRFSISDEPKGSINSQEISSIEPTKGTLINNLAASSGDESDFQDEERVFHSPDEQFDDTDGGTRFGGNAKEIKTTSCTGAYKQGDEREKSEGSGKCAADEPRRPAIRKTNPGERTIPGHDLLPKLPQRKPLAETDDDFHEWDFCPPSHRALCCRGPTVLKLRDGIAAGNCGNFISKRSCHNSKGIVLCCSLTPILYYDRLTGRTSYWAFGCVEASWNPPILPIKNPSQ